MAIIATTTLPIQPFVALSVVLAALATAASLLFLLRADLIQRNEWHSGK
jgi:hypothetical protein